MELAETETMMNEFVCDTCGHIARRHTAHTGPCADCWAEVKTICERFRPRAEDLETIKDLPI